MYGPEVATAAEVLWQASGRIGAHRLHPFVAELLERLTQSANSRCPLPWTSGSGRPVVLRSPGSWPRPRAVSPPRCDDHSPGHRLQPQIPIRTFTDWDDARPGFCEVDLVAHCGSSTQGFYLCTLCAVDVATTWIELDAVWGKGQHRVGAAFTMCGSACQCPSWASTATTARSSSTMASTTGVTATGSPLPAAAPWKKNDSAHVEQKNGAVVRHLVGYDRFASKAAYAQLCRVYQLARLARQFLPTRPEARHEDAPRRPRAPRLRSCPDALSTAVRRWRPVPGQTRRTRPLYHRLNPLQLRRELDAALDHLWTLAAPDPHRGVRPAEAAPPPPNPPGGPRR